MHELMQLKIQEIHIMKPGYRHTIWRTGGGFTLVEVMIVLVVIAIVAALAAPALLSMAPNMALKAASRDLYANVQRAKATAVKENRRISIVLGTDGYTVGEPFVDANGDGLYTTAPAEVFTDTNGDGAYTAETVVNFDNDFDYDIKPGNGTAANDWDGNPFTQTTDIAFNSRGLATVTPGGSSVFLDYLGSDGVNSTTCYAVDVRTAGSVRIYRYNGAIWE